MASFGGVRMAPELGHDSSGSERREFTRIRLELPVRYKFVIKMGDNVTVTERIFEGFTRNISAGGFLLVGKLPNVDYIPRLLTHKILLGINLELPHYGIIKALTQTAWVEAFEDGAKAIAIGLHFKDISQEARDEIFKFCIRQQMPG